VSDESSERGDGAARHASGAEARRRFVGLVRGLKPPAPSVLMARSRYDGWFCPTQATKTEAWRGWGTPASVEIHPPGAKARRLFCCVCGTLRLRSGQAIEVVPFQGKEEQMQVPFDFAQGRLSAPL